MIRHFFLDKTNTIIKGSEQNLGLNPILQIGYGNDIMRGLIHFDINPIKKLIDDKTFADLEKLTFTLRMTNCMAMDSFPYEKDLIRGIEKKAVRASSFDLILFKVPCMWDKGRGFDYSSDFWIHDKRSMSMEPSNWYSPRTGLFWDGSLKTPYLGEVEGGVYGYEFLRNEYIKYINDEDSVIVGSQHFDFGDEMLAIDITKYIFDVLDITEYDANYGLCLCFAPTYEKLITEKTQYVGFFNDNTNTFFHPYIEAKYEEFIEDDRESFTKGKNNRLYLYVNDDGSPANLDTNPICVVNNVEYETKQATKGVYYAQIPASASNMTEFSILTDMWSEIALNGVQQEDVELEFVVNPKSRKISIGSNSDIRRDLVPSVYGINDEEPISRGETREVSVDFRKKYSREEKILLDSAKYRLYTMDGSRELDVLPYQPIEKSYLNNFFIIYTEDLIPGKYFIDIQVKIGRETKYYNRILRFNVVSNVSERYE